MKRKFICLEGDSREVFLSQKVSEILSQMQFSYRFLMWNLVCAVSINARHKNSKSLTEEIHFKSTIQRYILASTNKKRVSRKRKKQSLQANTKQTLIAEWTPGCPKWNLIPAAALTVLVWLNHSKLPPNNKQNRNVNCLALLKWTVKLHWAGWMAWILKFCVLIPVMTK